MPYLGEMHKREWFAAQAMAALLANPTHLPKEPNETDQDFALRLATRAYEIADAMIHIGYRKDSRH
jgi:hypothetical protein